MGFFSMLFGSSASKLPQDEHQLSKDQIKKLVSQYNVRSLDAAEERLIEETIIARRRGDGKISLRQIDEALRKLKNNYKISDTDRKGIMKVFTEYFGRK